MTALPRTRIAHISDLHFGRVQPELLDPLVDALNAAAPDLVAVSGDLTQRARDSQFAEARAFLDRLSAPVLSVPGNHDVPLDRPVTRLLRPFRAYRKVMGRELEPTAAAGPVRVFGINTVSPYLWQRGWITRSAVKRLCARLSAEGGAVNVLVAHHPFSHGPEAEKDLMRGAGRALDALAGCGAHVVLSGHLHHWRTEPFVRRDGEAGALQVQIGSSLSTRHRGRPNDFALLDFEGETLRVARMAPPAGAPPFAEISAVVYRREAGAWTLVSGSDPVQGPTQGPPGATPVPARRGEATLPA